MNAKKVDKIAISTLYVIAGIIVTILAALILYILVRGIPHISWSFLTSMSSSHKAGGGIGVQLYNSLFLLVITLIISVPLSMGAGIFLSEYAKKGRLSNFVRTCIEILSSLPSVVVGLFGYLIFVVQFQYGFSILSGALALTVFNLPQMTRTVEDSLRTVHHTQREAGLALGLSRWETICHVVIPEALPGIVTGIVLSSGRIFGEAAALIYTAGQSAPALNWSNWNPLSISSPISIFRQAETLAVHIWKVNSEGTTPDATAVSAGSSAVLMIFILIFNFGARRLGICHVVIPEALPGIVTGIVLSSGRIFGEAAALIYTAGQSAPALNWSNWNPLSISSPISIFRQAETLAVHIWKVNSEGTTPDATAVSAGSSAVLMIFILIFNFGARRLGAYLHKKLTSA